MTKNTDNATCEPHLSCPLCSDEGLPARVIAIDESSHLATVQLESGEREVALDLLDGVQTDDFVLVHLDMAIAKLDPADLVRSKL